MGDLEDRKLWDRYQLAFTEAIRETGTEYAPWYDSGQQELVPQLAGGQHPDRVGVAPSPAGEYGPG